MVLDGWSDVNKLHTEGVILTSGSAATCALDENEAYFEHHGIAVARGWESFLSAYPDYNFSYHLSDDAGQCARACRILDLRHPNMIWQRCWSHQINLMVKHLLGLTVLRDACKLAIFSAKAINASSSKWSPQLRTRSEQMYGKHRSKHIMTVGETSWNSTQGCFYSLLCMCGACRVFAIHHQNAPKFPMTCIPWCENSFWITLKNSELLICPFCDASFLMQRNTNTMAHVLLVLLHLVKHIQESCTLKYFTSFKIQILNIFANTLTSHLCF